jgi:leader peptidase (prepilin peptidase)/N-methyltransferase
LQWHTRIKLHIITLTCDQRGYERTRAPTTPALETNRSMTEGLTIVQLAGAIFAALFGLAFGSFLNVVLTRMPEGESIATPGSHCRTCDHTLAWWENLPLLSWLLLRGRCRQCGLWIGLRYPLVELAIAILWTSVWFKFTTPAFTVNAINTATPQRFAEIWVVLAAYALFTWLLVALAALDALYFWLPDRLTLPGIAFGLLFAIFTVWQMNLTLRHFDWWLKLLPDLWTRALEAILCGGLILIIRLVYWLVRRREGMGLGDAKLMAMLGAWLGLAGGLECFAIAIFAAAAAALVWIGVSLLRSRSNAESSPESSNKWAQMPLPFGTFLCLAALSEIFYPAWLSVWWVNKFMR